MPDQGGTVPLAKVTAAGTAAVHSGLRAGYATHVEWWGQTINSNERI